MFEAIFCTGKNFDMKLISSPLILRARNKGSIWSLSRSPRREDHWARYDAFWNRDYPLNLLWDPNKISDNKRTSTISFLDLQILVFIPQSQKLYQSPKTSWMSSFLSDTVQRIVTEDKFILNHFASSGDTVNETNYFWNR